MSIHFITGNPGGGKGLLSMQKIVDELVHDERPIITNLPVRVEPWVRTWKRFGKVHHKPEIGLRHYLLKTYGKDFDCAKRVNYLQDEQVPEFYLHRRNGVGMVELPATRTEKKDGGLVVESYDTELAVKNGGVFYLTDECWKFWNARSWQKTGEGLLFYSAQHRHLGDTWYVVTQKTAQVDKALHRVAQDFAVVTNQSKLPMGRFRRPDVFTVCIYDQAPTGGQLQPVKRDVFKLDKAGLGACYDTAAGSGIGGGSGADLQERKTGWPWWVVPLLIVAMGFGLYLLSKGAGIGVGRILGGKSKPVAAAVVVAPVTNTVVSVVSNVVPQVSAVTSDVPRLTVVARFNSGAGWEITLSDGVTYKGNSVQVLGAGFVVIEGVSYRVQESGGVQFSTTAPRPSVAASSLGVGLGPERRTNWVYRTN